MSLVRFFKSYWKFCFLVWSTMSWPLRIWALGFCPLIPTLLDIIGVAESQTEFWLRYLMFYAMVLFALFVAFSCMFAHRFRKSAKSGKDLH